MNEDLNTQISQILADAKTIIDNQNKILATLPNAEILKNELSNKVNNDEFKPILDAMNLHLNNTNFAENGYTKLPNGLILQWMRIPYATYNQVINFPISFPTCGLCIVGNSVGDTSGSVNCIELEIKTNSSFRVAMDYPAPTYREAFYVFAIGY